MQFQSACASWRAIGARGLDWRHGALVPIARARDLVGELAARVPLPSWLSFKTHPLPALAADWINSGGGVEVVSEGELITLLKCGCPVDPLLDKNSEENITRALAAFGIAPDQVPTTFNMFMNVGLQSTAR